MVDGAQQAPESTAPPVDAPSPEAPPASPAQPEGEAPSDGRQPQTPGNYAALRPELSTIGRQRKAATEALGLDKNASPEDITTAIESLKSRQQAAVDDGVELPPELVEQQQQLTARAWQSAERDFGEDFTLQAQGLRELVMTMDDPYELTAALHEMAQSVAQAPPEGQQQEPPPAQNGAQPQQPQVPNVDMEVGQPGWKVQVDEDDEPGSGDTRGFFQKVLGQR